MTFLLPLRANGTQLDTKYPMFIAILSSILALLLLSEWYIYRTSVKGRSRGFRGIYYTLSTIATLPYLILRGIGYFWDISTTATDTISSIGITLLLINAVIKLCYATGKWLNSATKRRYPQRVLTIVAILVVVAILYGALWERFQLRTTEIELRYANLPEGADGLRIVQIGDLHIGLKIGRHKFLNKVADKVTSLGGDIVIDCGDMISMRYTELDTLAMQTLSRIKAPLGVYTVMGNHDNGIYITDTVALPRKENIRLLRERQEAMGWHNITDTTTLLSVGGDTLYLTAIDYPSQIKKGSHGVTIEDDYSHHFASLPCDAFNIVIAHTPSVWSNILSVCKAELTLSGHVHSMQLKIPIGERGWSPAALVYKNWSGTYWQESCALNITDGIGSSMPIRIGVKPEIVVITLKKE